MKTSAARLDFHQRRLLEKCEERGVRPAQMLLPFALSRKRSRELSSAEFGQAMQAVLLGVSPAEITDLLDRFERDREGNVTFEAFSAGMQQFADRIAGDWPTRSCEALGPPVPSTSSVIWLQLWDTVRDEDETAALSALSRFNGSLDERWNLWPELAHLPKGRVRADGVASSTLPLPASHGHAPRDQRMCLSKVLRTHDNTLAHLAAARNFPRFMEALLVRGAACDRPNGDGDTPSRIAVLMGHSRCVEVLGGEDGNPPVTWDECFKAIRDDSDEAALSKVRAFRRQGSRDPWGQDINTKRLEVMPPPCLKNTSVLSVRVRDAIYATRTLAGADAPPLTRAPVFSRLVQSRLTPDHRPLSPLPTPLRSR